MWSEACRVDLIRLRHGNGSANAQGGRTAQKLDGRCGCRGAIPYDFLVVGGRGDALSVRHLVPVKPSRGVEHVLFKNAREIAAHGAGNSVGHTGKSEAVAQ